MANYKVETADLKIHASCIIEAKNKKEALKKFKEIISDTFTDREQEGRNEATIYTDTYNWSIPHQDLISIEIIKEVD